MNKKTTSYFLLIFLFLAACTTKYSTFLDNNKCDPPCWNGIELGKTTREETLVLLKGIPEIDKESIQFSSGDGVYWDAGIYWNFTGVDEKSGEIYFHNDKAVFLKFFSESGIPVDDYFKELGAPEEVRIMKSIGDGVFITATINYPHLGICLEPRYRTNFKNPDKVNIQTSTRIYNLMIYQPDLISSQIRGNCLFPEDPNMIQQWKGFGDYKVFDLK